MFDFQTDFRFTAPVKVLVPTLDGQQQMTFTGEFRLVPKDEMEKAVLGAGENTDAVAMRLAFVGWKEDLTHKGMPWPFSEKAREELLSVGFTRSAIAIAYWRQVNGVQTEKN